MGKKLKNLKWKSVALEGLSAEEMTQNFEGFLGLEECTDYGLDQFLSKKTQKKKNAKKEQNKKRKIESVEETIEATTKCKKVRLSNGFTVESCPAPKPSLTNEDQTRQDETIKVTSSKENLKKKQKPKLGENVTKECDKLSLEDMESWMQFQIPDEILKALAEQGFKRPTKIQELTLPTAMHGRRDILGAAETGSGKTLAFGIPILAGIMKLKEQADSGLDVYEMPYKKSSAKKTKVTEEDLKPELKKKKIKKNKKQESSEEGYSSDSDNDKSQNDNDEEKSIDKKSDEEFLEEYDVPLRKKKETSGDESSDSDFDDDKYLHLSEMVDSDDFAETTDEEGSVDNDENDILSGVNDVESDDDGEISDDEENLEADGDEDDDDDKQSDNEEYDEDNQGIGCVKVIDDIEMPGHEVTKTGKPLYALILTPTRELAIQISRHLISAAKYTGIRIATIVGGMASVKQERVLSRGPEIVVATPGRLWELMRSRQAHLEQVDNIKFLAIDETDRMVERNHFEELHPLLERINSDEKKKNSRQNFVFSATLTMVHDLPTHMKGKKVTKRGKIINRKIKKMTPAQKVKKLVDMIGMTDPKVVDITAQNLGTAETLTECRIVCSLEEKDYYLYYVLKNHPGRTIVFCNSIGSVRRLAQLLGLLKCHPLPLHASMPQRQRLKNLERFRDDPCGVLVATDVAARGLDVPDVDHVVHYQVPRTAENYVHRSGRTARANKEGLTILMMEPGEAFLYSKLCKTLNKHSELPSFPIPALALFSVREAVTLARKAGPRPVSAGRFFLESELPSFPIPSPALSSVRDAVQLARRLDRAQLAAGRAARDRGWLDKAARDMDMIVDEDFVQVNHNDTKLTKEFRAMKKQLEAMLTKPLFPKGFSYKYPTLNTDAMNVNVKTQENALQVMKNAIESGELKKAKRTSKNAPLLKLEKSLKNNTINK